MTDTPTPDLKDLLEKAAETYRNMTKDERTEMDAAQKASFIRGMAPCEHGVRDFETCPECRGWHDTPTPDMTAPERYVCDMNHIFECASMFEDSEGGYVRYEDYAALSAKLAEAEAALAGYREMESESNARGGPNVVRLQMQARRDRIRAEAAEAERDAALGVLQEMRDDKTGFRDTVHFRRRAAAFLAARQKDGEG